MSNEIDPTDLARSERFLAAVESADTAEVAAIYGEVSPSDVPRPLKGLVEAVAREAVRQKKENKALSTQAADGPLRDVLDEITSTTVSGASVEERQGDADYGAMEILKDLMTDPTGELDVGRYAATSEQARDIIRVLARIAVDHLTLAAGKDERRASRVVDMVRDALRRER
jgi:hypothetical protein